jgi:D-glycero-alpha-D-manno-heptose-7-phosphate kinase
MIISRTPLRISIGGGGTDLPSYYSNSGGHVISAAIDKYIYIAINDTFTNDYFLKYSQLERAETRAEIKHPIIRAALTLLEIEPSVEIISMADIPAGTGLGSSGTFTVGLLKALYAHRKEHVPAQHLAELACHIEMDLLGEPVGKQDQFIAAFGGLTSFRFRKDGAVSAEALKLPPGCLTDLEHNLLLFFTGYSRSAGSILQDQATRSADGDAAMRRNLDETHELGFRIKSALEAGEPDAYGELLNEHWQRKRQRSQGMSNPVIDELYEFGLANGAGGGKLVGAGAGGFLLFYAHDAAPVRRAFRERGLQEVVFRFDHDGAVLAART